MTTQPVSEQDSDTRPGLLSVSELAAYLGIPVRTLYNWRQNGTGPKAFRVGKYLRYRREDVLAWEEEQLAKEGH